jgi:hypothetical protein
MFPKALNLYLGTSGAKPGDSPCSYTFLLIHLCRNVTVCCYLCFCRQLSRFCEEKITKKIIFYCDDEALKVFRKYRCHPVYSLPMQVRGGGGETSKMYTLFHLGCARFALNFFSLLSEMKRN